MSDYDKMSEEDLDEMVHDWKGSEAAEINNGGREAQIAYLEGTAPCSCSSDSLRELKAMKQPSPSHRHLHPAMAQLVGNRVYMGKLVQALKKLDEAETRDMLMFLRQCADEQRSLKSDVRLRPWKYM